MSAPVGGMSWGETVRTGLEAVQAHRMRSVLTMLGIIIGVSSVIVTVGLGQGAQDEVRKQIDSLGSNLLVVSPGSTTSSAGVRGGFGSASTLTLADAQAAGAVTLNYGVFINNVISFLIVAWAVFFLVRGLNRVKRKEEQAAPVEPPPTPEVPEDILLLREIRDNLKR